MKSVTDDPKYWRDRGQEMRASAARIEDEAARKTMLEIAENYERLAERIEARAKQKSAR